MADVDIQCLSCGNQITVSDVVDIAKLKCRACGGEFLRSNGEALTSNPVADEKRRSLMRKSGPAPAVNVAAAQEASPESPKAEINRLAWEKLNNPAGQAEVQRQSKRMYSALTWKAWVVFFVVAIIAAVLRYSGLVPKSILEQAAIYEAVAVFVMYLIISLKAFQDSVFQGILCVLLPPYSLYYLFSASDDFYLRAVMAGVLIGVGQDAGLLFHEWSLTGIEAVNRWIASGG